MTDEWCVEECYGLIGRNRGHAWSRTMVTFDIIVVDNHGHMARIHGHVVNHDCMREPNRFASNTTTITLARTLVIWQRTVTCTGTVVTREEPWSRGQQLWSRAGTEQCFCSRRERRSARARHTLQTVRTGSGNRMATAEQATP